MDVVYHRNCLDGIFSAYLMYLFAKSLPISIYDRFLKHLSKQYFHPSQQPIHTFSLLPQEKLLEYSQQQINQQFFHSNSQEVYFNSVSMYAGQFFPICPSKKDNILFVVDISPTDEFSLKEIAKYFRYVIFIDHHTTFEKTQNMIQHLRLSNVQYIWQQGICAAQLVLSFLNRSFNFLFNNYPQPMIQDTLKKIDFVGKNDLKINEDPQSKTFVLGFYYFQIEMSHNNPFLFKRLWNMKVETILEKGRCIISFIADAYKNHIQKLMYAASRCNVWMIRKGKFKNKKILGIQLKDRAITSDIGSILAKLSAQRGYENAAIIYKKSGQGYKISVRSQINCEKQPIALQIAKMYGGGGHTCAAGCYLTSHSFKSDFLNYSSASETKLSFTDTQNILFYSSRKDQQSLSSEQMLKQYKTQQNKSYS